MSRLGNGVGSVYKLSGNRKNPWAARKTVGFKENGQPIYKFIGYYRTKSEAMTSLMEFNKTPYSLNGERLCDIWDKFLPSYEDTHKPQTVAMLKSSWVHLAPLYEEPVARLTRKKLQTFFDEFQATKGVKAKAKTTLKMVVSYSIRYDIISPEHIAIFDYIVLSDRIPARKRDHKVFTRDEIEKIQSMSDSMSKAILFLIYTGLRAGEFCALSDENIDENLVIHINDSKTKAGIREVPLSDKAQKLAPLPHFRNYDSFKWYFNKWQAKHGFDHTLHDTRHTCISLLTEANVDSRIIKSIVGHKGDGVTEQVYTHISIEAKRNALNLI